MRGFMLTQLQIGPRPVLPVWQVAVVEDLARLTPTVGVCPMPLINMKVILQVCWR